MKKGLVPKSFFVDGIYLCRTVQYSLYLREFKVNLIGNGIWHSFLAGEQTKLKLFSQEQRSFALENVLFLSHIVSHFKILNKSGRNKKK